MQPDAPNIVLIVTDEQRFDAWGYANRDVISPHIDAMAGHSIVFTNAYTTNPSCVPARAAMATGRYPSQCGAPTFITYVDDGETTFMRLLRGHGYRTAVVGKQHFGETTIDRGYDHEDIIDQHFYRPERRSSYQDYLERAGFRDASELSRPVSRYAEEWTTDINHHIDRYVGDRAVSWLDERRPSDQPWFLCVSFPGPHQPFDCLGTPYADQYRLDELSLPAASRTDLEGKPPHYRAKAEASAPLTDDEIRQMRLAYYTNVTLIDEQIGRVVDVLRNSGEYDNTLIIVTTDHGDFLGDYGLVYKGQYLAEALMRVPLVVKPPGASGSGRRIPELVSNLDVAATCLTAAGVDVPAAMASRDLMSGEPRAYFFMEAGALRGIRKGGWKLVHYSGRPYGELYHLAADPWEQHNLWDEPDHTAIRVELYGRIVTEMTHQLPKAGTAWNVGAPLP